MMNHAYYITTIMRSYDTVFLATIIMNMVKRMRDELMNNWRKYRNRSYQCISFSRAFSTDMHLHCFSEHLQVLVLSVEIVKYGEINDNDSKEEMWEKRLRSDSEHEKLYFLCIMHSNHIERKSNDKGIKLLAIIKECHNK